MPTNNRTRSALAARIRAALLDMLGRVCAVCGDTAGPFQIDHPAGRDYTPRHLSLYNRMLRYWKEARVGACRVLCSACNQRLRPTRNQPPPLNGPPCPAYIDWLERGGVEPVRVRRTQT